MSEPDQPNRKSERVHLAVMGQLSSSEWKSLAAEMRTSRALRDAYREACHLDHELRCYAEEGSFEPTDGAISPRRNPGGTRQRRRKVAVLGLIGLATALVAGLFFFPREVATLSDDNSVRYRLGSEIESGSLSIPLRFDCTAELTLAPRSIAVIEGAKQVFLLEGTATVRADDPAAHGFVVRTGKAKVTDLGTVFSVRAERSGDSHVQVSSGKVEVLGESWDVPMELLAGDGISLVEGSAEIVSLIEKGDDTPAFRFATLPGPSDADWADESEGNATAFAHGLIRQRGQIPSGGPSVLLDGHGQSHGDAPGESLFFEDGHTGRVHLDLGESVAVQSVNTYTWHRNEKNAANRYRAVQRFTLYGHAGPEAPGINSGRLEDFGWVPITRVDSDRFFSVTSPEERPAQQGSAVFSRAGVLGVYRHLLFDLLPTPVRRASAEDNHAFLGEIDVIASPLSTHSHP